MFPHGETVTRRRGAPVTDPYSGEETGVDWSTPTDVDIAGCAVAIGSTDDPTMVARDAVVSDFTVYAPPGTAVLPSDRLVIRSLVCEVVGRPFEWRSPFTGWEPGVVVHANVVEG